MRLGQGHGAKAGLTLDSRWYSDSFWDGARVFCSSLQQMGQGLGRGGGGGELLGDEELKGEVPSHHLSSLAPVTLIGGSTSGADIYLVGRQASSLLNQDAKNNQVQLPRAPAQLSPACLLRQPFFWVLEANCFTRVWFLVLRTS